MKAKEYRAWRPTYSQYDKTELMLDNGQQWQYHERQSIIGLAAEAGELLALVQKAGRRGELIDKTKVQDELSDVWWYFNYVMDAFDLDLNEISDYNKKKLDARNA